jgi:hypothetical protein
VFFFCNSVAFLRCFWHFLLCLSRDQVSVWCVPSACLFLASEIPVCRRDHGNFLSYLRLDVLLRHLIIVLFAAVFTSVPWLFRLYFFLLFQFFRLAWARDQRTFFESTVVNSVALMCCHNLDGRMSSVVPVLFAAMQYVFRNISVLFCFGLQFIDCMAMGMFFHFPPLSLRYAVLMLAKIRAPIRSLISES